MNYSGRYDRNGPRVPRPTPFSSRYPNDQGPISISEFIGTVGGLIGFAFGVTVSHQWALLSALSSPLPFTIATFTIWLITLIFLLPISFSITIVVLLFSSYVGAWIGNWIGSGLQAYAERENRWPSRASCEAFQKFTASLFGEGESKPIPPPGEYYRV